MMTVRQLMNAIKMGLEAGEVREDDPVMAFCTCRSFANVESCNPNGRALQLNVEGALGEALAETLESSGE